MSQQAVRYRAWRPRWTRLSTLSRTRVPEAIVGVGAAVVVLGLCLRGSESDVVRAIEALVAVLLIAFCAARPFGSLAVLLVYVPLQPDVLP